MRGKKDNERLSGTPKVQYVRGFVGCKTGAYSSFTLVIISRYAH